MKTLPAFPGHASAHRSAPASARWRLLRRAALASLAVMTLGLATGCPPAARTGKPGTDPRDLVKPPVHPALRETIGEVALLGTNQPIRVNGYGIVAELPNTGSGDMPPNLRAIMTELLYRRGAGSHAAGTENIRPEAILSSNRVAVVQVYGAIPPMATKYSHFDLTLVALPGTQTVSLEHGLLWTSDLKVIGLADSDWNTRTLAVGRGPVYLPRAGAAAEGADAPAKTQPAAGTQPAGTQPAEAKVNPRRGLVLGGGMVIEDMPVQLQLYSPSDRYASQIQRVINARFPASKPYAAAQNDSIISLRIPPEYQDNPREFVDVVVHMYLSQEVPGFVEKKAAELVAALRDPKAPHRDLSLCLQGLGRTIIDDRLRPHYTDPNPTVRFYTAKAGAAMQDVQAMIVLEDIANDAKNPYQREAIAAIGAAGRLGGTERATVSLLKLINASDNNLRVAAYEALLRCKSPIVRSYWVPRKFQMDIVPSDGPTLIYAAQSRTPRLAIIGKQPIVAPGTLYVSPDNALTINVPETADHAEAQPAAMPTLAAPSPETPPPAVPDKAGADPVTMYYRNPITEKATTLKAPTYLPVLLARLAYTPNPMDKDYDAKAPFIGASYQRVVEMIATLCRDHAINATLVLQPPPAMEENVVDIAEGARPEGLMLTPAPTTEPSRIGIPH